MVDKTTVQSGKKGIENKKKVELLIPAQNKKSVQSAIGNADALYFGTETFNMRMNARNIPKEELVDFVNYIHDNGMRAYLTTNIIIYENELNLLKSLLEDAKTAEVDAVILHDFAAVQLAKEIGLKFHISTQASISNSISAKFYEKLGADRIILARELSLDQIKELIPKLENTKVETFIHGAMCTSISGRCYFSQSICESSEFSANRGKCVQPCRNQWRVLYQDGHEFDYDGSFFINAKDLCMIEYIPELIEAGISSFKVEGRMRDPHYIEIVSKIYRNAIDEYYQGISRDIYQSKALLWKEELAKVYNRGFSTGFYFRMPTALDVNRKDSGNQAPSQKVEVGRVSSYYREKQVARIELRQGQFKIGDDLYIEGGDLGSFVHVQLNEIYHKNKLIHETPDIGKLPEPYIITLKTESPVKQGDRIFIYK
jgi:putative protease